VGRPELNRILGGNPPRQSWGKPSLSAVRDELHRTDHVGAQHDGGVVFLVGQPLDRPLLLVELGVGALLPSPNRLVGDVRIMEDALESLFADGRDHPPLDRFLWQARETPLVVGQIQFLGLAGGEFDEDLALLVGELRRSTRPPLGLEHGYPKLVERPDEFANVIYALHSDLRDLRG